MKKYNLLILAGVLILPVILLWAEKKNLVTYTPQTISAQVLHKRLFKEGSYHDFAAWPKYEGFQKGRKAHGSYYKLYTSPELSTAWPLRESSAPDGTILVKEVYNKDKKKVEQILVMTKVAGMDDKNHDWYWTEFDPQGNTLQSGKLRSCAACHAQGKDNDFILSRMLK